jgi:hypothetical protein
MDCILETINDIVLQEQAIEAANISNEAAEAKHLPETVAQHNSLKEISWDGDVAYNGLDSVLLVRRDIVFGTKK